MKQEMVLVLFFLIFVLAGMTVAQGLPFQTSDGTAGSLEIIYPHSGPFKAGEANALHFHVFNASGILLTNDTVSCTGHIYGPTNNHVYKTALSFDGMDFEIENVNSSTPGTYGYNVWCNTSDYGGFVAGAYEVTLSGKQYIDMEHWRSFWPFLAIIAFISVIFFILAFKIEHPGLMFSSFGLGLILFVTLLFLAKAAYDGNDISGVLSAIAYLFSMALFGFALYFFWEIMSKGADPSEDHDSLWGGKWRK